MTVHGSLRRAYRLVAGAVRAFLRDDPFTQAGALSYYTLLSFAPFLLLLVAVVGLVYGADAARGEVVGQLQGLIGAEAATIAQDVLAQAHRAGGGGLSAALGGVFLLLGATTAFSQLRAAINQIWRVAPPPISVWGFVRDRLLGLLLILVLGTSVVALLVAGSIVAALAALPGADALPWVWRLADVGVGFAVMTALFAALFRILPDAALRRREVWLGAALTALLFGVGRWAIAFYLGRASLGSAYGAAGSAVVVMAWIYYSSVIVLFGAQVTLMVAHRDGADPAPTRGARLEGPEGHVRRGSSGEPPRPAGARAG